MYYQNKTNIMKNVQLEDIKLDQVEQVYIGKDNVCRCGCAGDYVSTSFNTRKEEHNDKLALMRIKSAQKKAKAGEAKVDYGPSYINVSYGIDRAITIYLL